MFTDWQDLMEVWETATSKEISTSYGIDQKVKATPDMEMVSVKNTWRDLTLSRSRSTALGIGFSVDWEKSGPGCRPLPKPA